VLASGEKMALLPMNLGAALDALAQDEVVKSALPGGMYDLYEWYKRDEWDKFNAEVSDWDVKTYLDCLP
ncbi:MAG: glutamine synthetase, partial [Gammaproteobacteria bacterium]